ncbi:unnamed protein product [Gemmata massiliana]|uniref:Uncharacterized protein n=1 Tax=Gemmata massiliana TaxID=1210884 RepID=A0A6P2CZG8_9BACT|nr:unnamed protein product [Gemmata massiliana]
MVKVVSPLTAVYKMTFVFCVMNVCHVAFEPIISVTTRARRR